MNIIIIGCGKVGKSLAAQLLNEGHNITVIDTDAAALSDAGNSLDILTVCGNGVSAPVLESAGIATANLLIAATGSDELNLLACLVAKKCSTCDTIARVKNPIYHKESGFFKNSLGLSTIINPDLIAAQEISRILRRRAALDINPFAKGRIEITKILLENDSPLVGRPLYELPSKIKCDVLICLVERGSEAIIPDGKFVLAPGDVISFLATPQNSASFLKKSGMRQDSVADAIIVGGSTTAYYLAEDLISHGIDAKIIEKNRAKSENLASLLPKATIICADGTNQNVLIEEGIDRADALVTLTNIDEENIMISLFARSQYPDCKVITKINRISFDSVIDKLDLGTQLRPKNTTAESVIRFVRARESIRQIGGSTEYGVEMLYRLIEDKVEALEFKVNNQSPLTRSTLAEVGHSGLLKKNILIGAILRGNRVIIPKGVDHLEVGDSVIVITSNLGLKKIEDILK